MVLYNVKVKRNICFHAKTYMVLRVIRKDVNYMVLVNWWLIITIVDAVLTSVDHLFKYVLKKK